MWPYIITVIIAVTAVIWNTYVNKGFKKFTREEISFFYDELKKYSCYYVNNDIQVVGENENDKWKEPKDRRKNMAGSVIFFAIIIVIGTVSAILEIGFSNISTQKLILGIIVGPLIFIGIFILFFFGRQKNIIDQITLKQNVLEITLLNDKDYTTLDDKTSFVYNINDISIKYEIIFNNVGSSRPKNHYLYIKDGTDKTKKYAIVITDDHVESNFRVLITFVSSLSRNIDINKIQNAIELEDVMQQCIKVPKIQI